MKSTIILLSPAALFLTACGTYTPAQVAKPSDVTLRQAVFEVATTLRDVQSLVPDDKKVGLMADEATIVFNVAASSKTTSGADLTVSNVPVAGGAIGGGASTENISEASRGNQVTIKFKNIATADMSKGVYSLKQFQGASKKPKKHPNKTGNEAKPDQSPGGIEKPVSEKDIREICEVSGLCVMKKDGGVAG